ncbi:hypothetical protein P154DRAFT_571741 [Amniculicola lignicola CBS 123094]|uniref:Uncharacterized protein n=1 Tax=Amniculicola lignicola CBS 123094 TaxID=1392246 RepID=A0A6A5WW79_9PLEO|nr:hypothetical protein P154DRAFT_571741 [Amniculicola lignicola CBS 123094]
MKCDKLTHTDAGGGAEDAFSGYWSDKATQGPPNKYAISKLYHRVDDKFYNGIGPVYGNNFEGGGGYIQAHMDFPTKEASPILDWGFNCFTEDLKNPFKFDHEKYGTCRTHVWCVQKDVLHFAAWESSEVRKAWAENLPVPSNIYSRFNEIFDKNLGHCDPKPLELEYSGTGPATEKCTVSFRCTNNDKAILDILVTQLKQFGDKSQYKDDVEKQPDDCKLGGCSPRKDIHWRSVPSQTSLIARGIPPPGSGRFGYEVAHIQAKITCKAEESNQTFCKVIGPLFGLIGLNPAFGPAASFAGATVASACGTQEIAEKS